MKCFFALSGNDERYVEMAKVLVCSAKKHTNLELICVLDGCDPSLVDWLKRCGVKVLEWEVTFLQEIIESYKGQRTIEFCRGTYLCMELPKIIREYGIDEEFVLYVDVDVMFRGPFDIKEYTPAHFASAADWGLDDRSRFSTGVIVMNTKSLFGKYDDFLAHLRNHKFDFSHTKMGPCDQGAWNTFYSHNEHDWLDPKYDWKPWWGINPEARIVHFSGPKPQEVERLLGSDSMRNETEQLHSYLVAEYAESYQYYVGEWKKLFRDDVVVPVT